MKRILQPKKKVSWAKRVHGVYGFDAAHKVRAEVIDTERFVTVDGDTVIEEDFTKVMVDFPSPGVDNTYHPVGVGVLIKWFTIWQRQFKMLD